MERQFVSSKSTQMTSEKNKNIKISNKKTPKNNKKGKKKRTSTYLTKKTKNTKTNFKKT